MGQSKARQLRETAFLSNFSSKIDLPRLATAMRKLATAASKSLGADCYLHAALTKAVLADVGVDAEVTIGFAAWRVANGDGDVIVHAPSPQAIQVSPYSDEALPFHVWLRIEDSGRPWILDFSTYQLRRKATDLDALDGGTTHVAWCPEFLFMPEHKTRSLAEVTRGNAGWCYYAENSGVKQKVLAGASELDPSDINALRMLYGHPEMAVVGPNGEST